MSPNVLKWVLLPLVILIAGCGEKAPSGLEMPEVVKAGAEAGIRSVTLAASFDRSGGISSCGFILLSSGGSEIARMEATPAPSIRAEYEGLEPDTEYSWTIWFSNGLDTRESALMSFRTQTEPKDDPGDDPKDNPGDDPKDDPKDDPGNNNPSDDPPKDDPEEKETWFIPGEDGFSPDKVLWQFLLDNYDTDGDGVMSRSELLAIKELTISDLLVDSLAGLETLKDLETLYMGGHLLNRIDLSANKKLSMLSAGRERILEELYLDNPVLSYIYLVGCPSLRTIDLSRCPDLGMLDLYEDALDSLDLSKNLRLEVLRMSGTKLKKLDLSVNRRLAQLASENNTLLDTIILHRDVRLESCDVEAHTKIIYK